MNLLNDMHQGQIPQKIKDVFSQQPELNDSGSKASKSSILDLHCRDEHYNFIEIEIQIERETNFLKRLLFYSSQMIVQQGEPGPDWDYDVKPVYFSLFASPQGTSTSPKNGKVRGLASVCQTS
nr:PD-(D/E)XK nuclease family transposase [Fibrobacter sp.]